MRVRFFLIAVAVVICGCGDRAGSPADKRPVINVFAAASGADAIEEIAANPIAA